jgi:hypothetical protein
MNRRFRPAGHRIPRLNRQCLPAIRCQDSMFDGAPGGGACVRLLRTHGSCTGERHDWPAICARRCADGRFRRMCARSGRSPAGRCLPRARRPAWHDADSCQHDPKMRSRQCRHRCWRCSRQPGSSTILSSGDGATDCDRRSITCDTLTKPFVRQGDSRVTAPSTWSRVRAQASGRIHRPLPRRNIPPPVPRSTANALHESPAKQRSFSWFASCGAPTRVRSITFSRHGATQ